MNNIYETPKSEIVEFIPKGQRPLGIIIISILFVLFSAASTLIAFFEVNGEWEIVFGCSLLLLFLLRGVYLGKESARKTAIFFGFLVVFMNFFGFYEESSDFVYLQKAIYITEGVYSFIAAIYLIKLKGNPFFNE